MKNITNTFFLLTLLFFSNSFILAQNSKLPLYAEKFTYKDPLQERFITEVYISFAETQIKNQMVKKNDTLDVIVEIYRNEILSTKGWHLFPLAEFINDKKMSIFLDNFAFALKEGENTIKISVKNRNPQNMISGYLEEKITTPKYPENSTFISDLLISDLIAKPTDLKSHFIKNGILVQPYPIKIFSPAKYLLYYYLEIYNLKEKSPNDYSTLFEILDESGKIVKRLKSPKINLKGKNGYVVSGQNIMSLKEGRYTLNAFLAYKDKPLDKKVTSFTVRKKKKIAAAKGPERKMEPEYLTKTEDEINDEIYILKYIMKEKTWKNFKTMSLENKKLNLSLFWKQNDYTKDTPENEFKIKYLDLARFVREQYSDSKNDGIDTDMGRVVLLYGKPDYINRNTDDDLAGQSVEVWQYNNFQAYFLFVQENFTGPYRMVHSTMKGEIYDPFWVEYLKSNEDLLNR